MAKKQRVSVVGTVLTVEYPTIGKKFTVDYSKYGSAVQVAALAHGFKQKFGDAASGESPAEKFAEVGKIHESLLAGEWERTVTIDLTPLICQAVASIRGVKLAKIEEVAKVAPDKVKEWGTNLKVKAWIAEKRAKDAAARAEEAEDLNIDL